MAKPKNTNEVFDFVAEAQARARQEFSPLWRRLKSHRDGLARAIAARAPPMLCEDADILLAEASAGHLARLDAARRALLAAEIAHAEHGRSGGVLARLNPGWRRRRAELNTELAGLMETHAALTAAWAGLGEALRHRAAAAARENRAANARAMAPTAIERANLLGLDDALEALERGDGQVAACLRRLDFDALPKVAALSRILREQGTLSERDYAYYLSAGLPPPAEPQAALLPEGRPHVSAGEIVRVAMTENGGLSGSLVRPYDGLPAGTRLAGVGVLRLARFLEDFRKGGLAVDAELLEAYLEVAMPDWRVFVAASRSERQNADPSGAAARGSARGPTFEDAKAETPYDVLGVTPDTPMVGVKDAFRTMMLASQSLPNTAPQRRLIAAYRQVKASHALGAGACAKSS